MKYEMFTSKRGTFICLLKLSCKVFATAFWFWLCQASKWRFNQLCSLQNSSDIVWQKFSLMGTVKRNIRKIRGIIIRSSINRIRESFSSFFLTSKGACGIQLSVILSIHLVGLIMRWTMPEYLLYQIGVSKCNSQG